MSQELIVVAEDSAPNRNILVHLLKKLDYEVKEFENGKAAWEFVNGEKPENLTAIISDIMMPEMDGLEFLRHVREQSHVKEIPFILVTAISDRDHIMEAKELNVNGYILKPVTFQRVIQKLKQLFPDRKFKEAA